MDVLPLKCLQVIRLVISLMLGVCALFSIKSSLAQEPLIIPQQDQIDYGVISNKTGICRMNRRGNLMGLAGQDCVGSGQSGRFIVFGFPNTVVNVQVVGSQISNVRFTPRINGRSTRRLGGNARRNIRVFGDLEIFGPAAGRFSLSYLLNINYE